MTTNYFFLPTNFRFFAHEFHEFTRNMLKYINGDLIGRTNFH